MKVAPLTNGTECPREGRTASIGLQDDKEEKPTLRKEFSNNNVGDLDSERKKRKRNRRNEELFSPVMVMTILGGNTPRTTTGTS